MIITFPGTFLFALRATDGDDSSNEITFFTNDIETNFYVNITQLNKTSPTVANITLKNELDRESNEGGIELKFSLNDTRGNNIKKSVRLYILDTCDESPKFERPSYTMEIYEDTQKEGFSFREIHATDRDNGNFAVVTYSMEPKTESDYWTEIYHETFRMDPTNATVTLLKQLDYENNSFYQFTLHAHDTCNLTAVPVILTIKVKDVQDKPPFFIGLPYMRIIPEGNYNNSQILRVEAFDGDLGIPNKVNYSFVSTSECSENNSTECNFCRNLFTINSSTGDITITGNLDWEQQHVLDIYGTCNIAVEVIAKEEKNPSHTDTTTVIVKIENVNEYSPMFENETYEARIEEEATNWTSVINITATDNDTKTDGKVTYSLSGGNNLFSVNNETGQVFTNCQPWQLDREQTLKIYLTIIATDEGGRMNQAQLIVSLTDRNDNPPVFQQERYTAFLEENSTEYMNKTFVTVKTNDADQNGTNNSEVSYIIGNTTWKSNFTINSTTGEIRLVSQLDYEALNDSLHGVINLTIFAYDHGIPVKSGNVTVTILVQVRLSEWSLPLMLIKTERNNKISFAIEAGGFDNFRINSTTGNVTVQVGAHFDRDDINLYNLTIIAIDQGANSFTATTTMSVTITDVNNKPPKFNQSSYSITTPENMAVGSFITNCIAMDPDENPSLSYNISGIVGWNETGGNSYIGIHEKNGALYVTSVLDRETVTKLEMTIFVNDTGAEENKPQIAMATVTITALDVDDNPPRFKHSSDLRVGMRRNMEPDKEIFELKSYVTDKDSPQNAIDMWVFQNVSFIITSDLKNKLNGLTRGRRCHDLICVNGNGTIVNNMYYTQDMSGFFNVTVLVRDDAGNDTAYILIFLIGDSQVLKMTLYGSRTNVALLKDDILSDCSNVTGLLFVYDSITDHKADDNTVDTLKTDLFFHIQDHKNNKVLSAEEAKRLLDEYADKLYYARMKHNIVSIESSLKSDNPENESSRTIYVMAAVIGLLAFVVLIVGYMFFCSSNRYKRKLRAAMPSEKEMSIKKKDDFVVPGSNIYAHKDNPLFNTPYAPPEYKEIDATSQNSLDKNDVDDANISQRDELEEREVTLDMYGEDYYTQILSDDPLEAALRDHDAQKQASLHKLGDSRVDHSKNDDDEETMVNGFVNNGFHHNLELETSEI